VEIKFAVDCTEEYACDFAELEFRSARKKELRPSRAWTGRALEMGQAPDSSLSASNEPFNHQNQSQRRRTGLP
jgi:hypothetical protein